jgi:hypothetical protein
METLIVVNSVPPNGSLSSHTTRAFEHDHAHAGVFREGRITRFTRVSARTNSRFEAVVTIPPMIPQQRKGFPHSGKIQ